MVKAVAVRFIDRTPVLILNVDGETTLYTLTPDQTLQLVKEASAVLWSGCSVYLRPYGLERESKAAEIGKEDPRD